MPEMKEGETQGEWMKRCVPVRIKEGEKQDQAVAVCLSMWRQKHGGEKPKAKTFDEVMKQNRVTSPLGDEREFERNLFTDPTYAYQAEPVPDVGEEEFDTGVESEEGDLDDEVDTDEDILDENMLDEIDFERDMALRAKLFDEVIKQQPGPQSVHQTTALGNSGKDKKRRGLLSVMAEEPHKEADDVSVENQIVDESKRWSLPLKIIKADAEQKRIFGWASVVMKNGRYVIDKQGDIIPVDELENAVFNYMLDSRDHGHMHSKRGTGRLIMSMLTTPDIMEAFGLTQKDDQVGWIAGYQVDDPEVWAAHKRGELPDFSIAGAAQPVEIDVDDFTKRRRVRRHARFPF